MNNYFKHNKLKIVNKCNFNNNQFNNFQTKRQTYFKL